MSNDTDVPRTRDAGGALAMLRRLGEVRDGLLILAALLYGVGYLAWSLFAWIYGLGTAPPFDAQYFLIGTPLVAALIALGCLIYAVLRRFLPNLASWSADRPRWVRLFVAVLLGCWVLVRSASYLINQQALPHPLIYASLILLVTVYGSIIAMLFGPSKSAGRNAASISLVTVVTMLLSIGMAAYVLSAYRYIPQQIGGGRLRRAQIEVRSDVLSPELLEELGCKSTSPDDRVKVQRTHVIWLLIGAGDTLIIIDGPDLLNARMRVEVPRSSISAILWRE